MTDKEKEELQELKKIATRILEKLDNWGKKVMEAVKEKGK